jgi:hypothetical protein
MHFTGNYLSWIQTRWAIQANSRQMNLVKFVRSRPYLYHLTHRSNVESILTSRRIESTSLLAERVALQDRVNFLSTRRPENVTIQNDIHSFVIRDQAQVKENALRRSLVDCTYEQFITLLNSRVFFWPTLKDVRGHFGTYQEERPNVLRFRTADVIALNNAPLFCRFNSGATRPHPAYGGSPAPRGFDTFVAAENFEYIPSKVREVTFGPFCLLPDTYGIAEDPNQEFTQYP